MPTDDRGVTYGLAPVRQQRGEDERRRRVDLADAVAERVLRLDALEEAGARVVPLRK